MSLHILVVEDEPRIRGMLKRGLELAGHSATVSDDLATARAVWTSDRFDLVLLDVMLPDGDGLELLAERRAEGDETPTLLLSAREESELHQRAAAAGATDYLAKPFPYAELLARVESLARRR